jgi:hypothetical protein
MFFFNLQVYGAESCVTEFVIYVGLIDNCRPSGVVLFRANPVASADRITGVYNALVGVNAILIDIYVPSGLGLKKKFR